MAASAGQGPPGAALAPLGPLHLPPSLSASTVASSANLANQFPLDVWLARAVLQRWVPLSVALKALYHLASGHYGCHVLRFSEDGLRAWAKEGQWDPPLVKYMFWSLDSNAPADEVGNMNGLKLYFAKLWPISAKVCELGLAPRLFNAWLDILDQADRCGSTPCGGVKRLRMATPSRGRSGSLERAHVRHIARAATAPKAKQPLKNKSGCLENRRKPVLDVWLQHVALGRKVAIMEAHKAVALVLAGYRRRTLPVSTATGDIEIHVGDFDNLAVRTALDKLATGSTLPGRFSQATKRYNMELWAIERAVCEGKIGSTLYNTWLAIASQYNPSLEARLDDWVHARLSRKTVPVPAGLGPCVVAHLDLALLAPLQPNNSNEAAQTCSPAAAPPAAPEREGGFTADHQLGSLSELQPVSGLLQAKTKFEDAKPLAPLETSCSACLAATGAAIKDNYDNPLPFPLPTTCAPALPRATPTRVDARVAQARHMRTPTPAAVGSRALANNNLLKPMPLYSRRAFEVKHLIELLALFLYHGVTGKSLNSLLFGIAVPEAPPCLPLSCLAPYAALGGRLSLSPAFAHRAELAPGNVTKPALAGQTFDLRNNMAQVAGCS
ncbi:uncharacterized protein JCM10292_003615 [Rhodotorula paludigena]|uniref:uncharacterized protein n=1 Tax=Rhodotorula paludigena TaxID=86838 RepID=UPI00316FA2D1